VGANKEAVIDGFNGFHADGVVEWERALQKLIASPALRATLGMNGLAHVRDRYAMSAYQKRYLGLLDRLAAA
jgi:glycosyltransferase involved in cell wall biosynthesis